MVQSEKANTDTETDHEEGSIESTSHVDWSRVRTRAETVVSSDDESGSQTGSHLSDGNDDSYDLMDSSGQSIELQSVPTRTSFTSSGSTMSLEDAQSSIDAFFTNREGYTSNQANKLRFWQALCVEFGLVDMSANPLPSFSDLEIVTEDSEDAESSAYNSNSPSTQSIVTHITTVNTPTSTSVGPSASKPNRKGKGKKANLPPLPTSLTQAKHLLATKAHVNLKDYMVARHESMYNSRKDNIPKGPATNFAYLVHPSQRALINYTLDTGKFIKKGKAKNEWLQPMLKTIC